jgi:hypothetical protein
MQNNFLQGILHSAHLQRVTVRTGHRMYFSIHGAHRVRIRQKADIKNNIETDRSKD